MKTLHKNYITSACALSFALSLAFVAPVSALGAGPEAVDLSSAGNFVILSKSGISTTGPTQIVGDIGVSPIGPTSITGFGLSLSAGSAFATSSLISGKVYAPGYAAPTPSMLTTAIGDMQTAYTNGVGRTNPTATELGAGNIGGLTIAPGLYKWGTGVIIPTDVTLSGSSNDVWIFQIAQTLTVSSGAHIVLSGGAQARNIFWIVAGQTTIGTTAVFNGNIIDQTAIVLSTGATLNGRALAQTAVTLDSNAVTVPSGASVPTSSPTPTPTPVPTPSPTPVVVSSNTEGRDFGSQDVLPVNTVFVTSNVAGCTSTSGFSGLSGILCSSSTSAQAFVNISGCNNGSIGFSGITGQSCTGNISNPHNDIVIIGMQYNFGSVVLKQWITGEAVKDLQKFLNAKLGSSLVVDGILGPKTTVAIKDWQDKNGLIVDGIVGSKTKTKMYAEVK